MRVPAKWCSPVLMHHCEHLSNHFWGILSSNGNLPAFPLLSSPVCLPSIWVVSVIDLEWSLVPSSLTNDTLNSYGVNGCSPCTVTVLVLDLIISALCQVLSVVAHTKNDNQSIDLD